MAPPKGKQGTKGGKQIVEENKATLKMYTLAASGFSALNITLYVLFFWDYLTYFYMFMTLISIATHVGAIHFMKMMSHTVVSSEGALLDSGTDLNMESGMAENAKDLIILASATQLLTIISTYFWALYLAVPARGGHLLWVYVLQPWLTSGANEEEVDEKKMKKKERKMKRQVFVRR